MRPRKILETFEPYDYPKNSRKDFLRLDFGENLIGCSPKVIDRLRNITSYDLSIYPEYDSRKKLAKFLKIDEKNLILTNGSDDAIRLVMEAYLEKDDGLILMDPSFYMFEFYARLRETKISKVLLNEDLSFPAERFLESITKKTRMIMLCSPNNPTGTVIERQDIIKIIEKTKGLVLVDEAYFEFYGKSVIDLVDRYDNLVITRTFSKQAGLAGLRIGAAIGCEEIISKLRKISSPYAVNSLACIALDAAIDDWGFVTDYVEEVKRSKMLLFEELKKLEIKTYETNANFFIADFEKDVSKVCKLLEKKGILIRDRSKFPLLNGCARITIGTIEQSKYFISELKKVIPILELDTLLFDMDGVLVDVSKSYRVAIKETVKSFCFKEVSFEEIQSYKEKGGLNNDWDCTAAILKDLGIGKTREEIQERFDAIYLGGTIDNERLIVKKELLEKLAKRFKLALITGRPKRDADYTIKKFGLDRFFAVVKTMDDDIEKSDSMKKSVELLDGKNAIYIGDTIDDMSSAKRASFPSIGIMPPIASDRLKALLIENGASIVFEDVNELEVLI
jgi:histidinol-phosphate aminotransferase